MADILSSEDYEGIRELLGVDALELPDAVIEQPPFLLSAESAVKRAISDWAERLADAGDAALLHSAVMYGTAARLVTRLQNRLRSGEASGNWSAGQIDWKDVRAELEAGYAAAIRALIEDDSTVTLPVGAFTVAGISRSRERREGSLT